MASFAAVAVSSASAFATEFESGSTCIVDGEELAKTPPKRAFELRRTEATFRRGAKATRTFGVGQVVWGGAVELIAAVRGVVDELPTHQRRAGWIGREEQTVSLAVA
eukprot:1184230-Prorocentrum_minimum.AAC.3